MSMPQREGKNVESNWIPVRLKWEESHPSSQGGHAQLLVDPMTLDIGTEKEDLG